MRHDSGIAHTIAALLAIVVVVVASYVRNKIQNPSPPPPEGADFDDYEPGTSDYRDDPRGDVDLELCDCPPHEQTALCRSGRHTKPRPAARRRPEVVYDDEEYDGPVPRWRQWLGI